MWEAPTALTVPCGLRLGPLLRTVGIVGFNQECNTDAMEAAGYNVTFIGTNSHPPKVMCIDPTT